ncbi:hypothetical protein TNIN_396371, partial [Trichonephila inaurata madagascariensis]
MNGSEVASDLTSNGNILRNGDAKAEMASQIGGGGVKRGTDELLSQSGAVSNGNAMSPETNDNENNNDAKK